MPDPSKPPFLSEVLPPFARELEELLMEEGEPELAAQVPELRILKRCPCGDSFCSTFYVRPEPRGSYSPNHRNVELSPEKGMIILDIVDGWIASVEVLYRDDVRKAIQAVVP